MKQDVVIDELTRKLEQVLKRKLEKEMWTKN